MGRGRARWLAALVGLIALVGAAVAAPAPAAPVTAPGSGQGDLTVLLQLAEPEPEGLLAMASDGTLTRAERIRRLRRLEPSRRTRQHVLDALRDAGLRAQEEGPWLIRASGPADLVAALLGGGDPVTGRQLVPPAELRGEVTAVLGAVQAPTLTAGSVGEPTGGAPVTAAAPADAREDNLGGRVREMYDVGALNPRRGVTPVTVATIELWGWDPSDLTDFAANLDLPDPVTSGQYVGVSVAGGVVAPNPIAADAQESALDQEAILAVAPRARQRMYVTPIDANYGAGNLLYLTSALAAVYRDATDPNRGSPIVALSLSFGFCESLLPAQDRIAFTTAVNQLNAAGVTVFVSSGDRGSNCKMLPPTTSRTREVEAPSMLPNVTAVGGVTTTPGADVTGWSGSGGGLSASVLRPPYQSSLPDTGRSVPDIAADSDPGMVMSYQGQWLTVGGTSLAAPIAAASLADVLMNAGRTSGIGQINGKLYKAAAGGFTDITTGSNGAYSAGVGYDRVTGLGLPQWSHLAPALLAQPYLQVPLKSRTRAVPITVHAEPGFTYVRWRAGTGTPPTTCAVVGSAAPPTSVVAPADGARDIWVQGLDSKGGCHRAITQTKIDSTPPTAAPTRLGVPNAFGWDKGPVRVYWHWSDATSALDSDECPSSSLIAESGNPVIDRASCSDVFGNRVTRTFTAKVDLKDPVASVALGAAVTPVSRSTRVPISFSGSDAMSGVEAMKWQWASADVDDASDPSTWTWSDGSTYGSARTGALDRGTGHRLCFRSRARDLAGNVSAWSRPACTSVPIDDRSLVRAGAWTLSSSSGALASTLSRTVDAGATLTSRRLTAGRVGVLATRCPTCGRVRLSFAGSSTTFNLAGTAGRVLLMAPARTYAAEGVATITALDEGKPVFLDGLAVLPGAEAPAPSTGATAVSAGTRGACALRDDDTVWCWGDNTYGQVGDGTTVERHAPARVQFPDTAGAFPVQVSRGGDHTCARLSDQSVWCWGRNQFGQLGDGTTTNRTTPVKVAGLSGATSVATSRGGFTCAIKGSASMWCWGSNGFSQLGQPPSVAMSTSPLQVLNFSSGTPSAIALGLHHACAIGSYLHRVECWGQNHYGQVGNGQVYPPPSFPDPTGGVSAPAMVITGDSTPLTGAVAISAGDSSTCATTAAAVLCWGDNSSGQVGQPVSTDHFTRATQVSVIGTPDELAVGGGHACVLTTAPAVQCWGYNASGQLGSGGTVDSASPVSVAGLPASPTGLAAGTSTTCAVLADTSVACWGSGSQGALGNGGTTGSPVPVRVSGIP